MRIDRSAFHLMQPQLRRWSLMRKLRNPFAGLRFFRRNSGGDLIIVSRHWPHLLCWSWHVLWMRGQRGRGVFRHNAGGTAWLGPLRLSWQTCDWSFPANANRRTPHIPGAVVLLLLAGFLAVMAADLAGII